MTVYTCDGWRFVAAWFQVQLLCPELENEVYGSARVYQSAQRLLVSLALTWHPGDQVPVVNLYGAAITGKHGQQSKPF